MINLAVFDFVPNLAFLIGAYFLVRIILLVSGRDCGRLAMAGTLLVFLGGFFQATWKLLYAARIGDIRLLGEIQFILLAPGFLAMVVALILMVRKKSGINGSVAVIAVWKIPLLMIMTVCSLGTHGILTYLSFKRSARIAATSFVIAFLGTLSMGGMASAEQTISMQWIEEGINTLAQLGFAIGTLLLYQNYKVNSS